MSLLCCLRCVLKGTHLVEPNSTGEVTLEEPKKMEVRVSGLDENVVVVCLQEFGRPCAIEDGAWTQCCDYLIVRRDTDTVQALLVELKSHMKRARHGFEQLRRSLPLVSYLVSLCRIECRDEFRSPRVRYALVAKKGNRLDKQRIRPGGALPSARHAGIEISQTVGRSSVRFSELWELRN